MRSIPSCLVATLLLATACAEIAPPTAPPLAATAPRKEGDPCSSPNLDQPCTDPGISIVGWPFFGTVNDVLYEAPNDPSPGAPGIWLGAAVTPAACFNDLTRDIVDRDHDWLDDGCELELARGFAPRWSMGMQDGCPDGEPAWAAKYFNTAGVVRIAFMPAYYTDCGGGGHPGDSEFVMEEVAFNATTQHWELQMMWLSAHHDVTVLGFSTDRSQWVPATEAEYSRRYLGYPKIAVSAGKHANYKSDAKCNNNLAGEADLPGGDSCYDSMLSPFRFPIDPTRNAGSRFVDLMQCPTSTKRFAGNGQRECFYGSVGHGFAGWQGGAGVAPYSNLLNSEFFEFRSGDAGPGPEPAPGGLAATMSGPGYVSDWTFYTWSVAAQNCNPTCSYQWRYQANGFWQTLGTDQTQQLNAGPALGPSFLIEVTISTGTKESVIRTMSVTNGTWSPPPPEPCADPRMEVCEE